MGEREADDTTKPDGPPQPEGERPAGGYYYDDATGYEVYDPAEEEDGDEDEE